MHFPSDDRVPARLRLLSLSEDVLVEVAADGDHLVAFTRWGEIVVDDAGQPVRDGLQRMSLGPVSIENLPGVGESFLHWKSGRADESCELWYRFWRVLERLGCCVQQSLGMDDSSEPILSVEPVCRGAQFWLPPAVDTHRPIRLSRFMAIRTQRGELLLESPLSRCKVVLHRPQAAWLVSSLGRPSTVAELAALLRIPLPVVADVVAYLLASGMVLAAQTGQPGQPGAQPAFAEDNEPALVPWSHHDLMFHARSRMGRHGEPSGAVFPHADRMTAPPVTRDPPPGDRYPLPRPQLTELAELDPSLTEVVERRRGYRDAGHPPTGRAQPDRTQPERTLPERALTAELLGELLFRVARIRWTKLVRTVDGISYMVSDRPYPSTADLYELELYLSLDRCAGLPRGNYHYDPREHALTLIGDGEAELVELMDTAKVAAGSTRRPAAVITVTSRIARLAWMYSGIAYATTLKHVGALQLMLQLEATAMGLACGAVAVGDGVAADLALRLEWPAEVSVGEFIVGGRP
jgi:SagB-type dehydrogenase family enzyme